VFCTVEYTYYNHQREENLDSKLKEVMSDYSEAVNMLEHGAAGERITAILARARSLQESTRGRALEPACAIALTKSITHAQKAMGAALAPDSTGQGPPLRVRAAIGNVLRILGAANGHLTAVRNALAEARVRETEYIGTLLAMRAAEQSA